VAEAVADMAHETGRVGWKEGRERETKEIAVRGGGRETVGGRFEAGLSFKGDTKIEERGRIRGMGEKLTSLDRVDFGGGWW